MSIPNNCKTKYKRTKKKCRTCQYREYCREKKKEDNQTCDICAELLETNNAIVHSGITAQEYTEALIKLGKSFL